MMTELHSALLEECRRIAEYVLYNYEKPELIKEIWTISDRENLALKYFEHCKAGLELVNDGESDPFIVLRSVQYLSGQAMPSSGESTDWFRHGLFTLLILACPYTGSPPGGEPFFEDICKGMAKAEAWGKEEEN